METFFVAKSQAQQEALLHQLHISTANQRKGNRGMKFLRALRGAIDYKLFCPDCDAARSGQWKQCPICRSTAGPLPVSLHG